MTQTSEPGIKSQHREGERTRGNGAQTTKPERHAISDNSKHLQFAIADLETNSALVFFSIRSAYRAVFAMLLWMSKYPSYTGLRLCQILSQTSER